ncbi:MAG: ABC transporter substrate-binding protein, partial [bacterium]
MKKVILVITVLVSLAFIFSGSLMAQKPKVVMWIYGTFYPKANAYWEEIAKQWSKERDVDVEFSVVPYDIMTEKLAAAIEAGIPPDIAQVVGEQVQYYGQTGAVEDVRDLFEEIRRLGGGLSEEPINPTVTSEEGNVWAIPINITLNPLFVRKDIIKEGGFALPTTWEEIRTISRKLKNPPRFFPFGIVLARCVDAHQNLMAMIWSFGGKLVEKDGMTVAVNSPETLEAIKFIADMYLKDGTIPPGSVAWDDGGNNRAWQGRQTMFVMNPLSIHAWMVENDQDLLNRTAYIRVPKGPAEEHVSFTMVETLMVFKDARHPDLAKDFIRYMLEPKRYIKLVETVGGYWYPVYKDLGASPFWSQPIFENLPLVAKDGRIDGWPARPTPASGEVSVRFVVPEMFQKVVVDGWDPQKALDWAEKEMIKIYKDYYPEK